jgi:hypothetical protein
VAAATLFARVPPGGISLHVSVVESEIGRLRSVDRRIVWQFRQCFSDVIVTVDTPHGGKTYAADRSADPVYLEPNNGPVPSPSQLQKASRTAITPAITMLTLHCRHPPILKIVVLNHTRLDSSGWLKRAFSDPATRPDVEPAFRDLDHNRPMFERFFKNTVMYVYSIVTCRTRYLLHFDIDVLGLTNTVPTIGHTTQIPGFVRTAVLNMRHDNHTMFATPGSCSSGKVAWFYTASTRLFMVDTHRFRSMLPLVGWADHVEEVLKFNMGIHKLKTMWTKGRPCISSSYTTRHILHNTNW